MMELMNIDECNMSQEKGEERSYEREQEGGEEEK